MQNKPDNKEISFVFCNYSNEYHRRRFAELINNYISDPMGESNSLSSRDQLLLIDGMENHPSGFVLFAVTEMKIVGLVTCFILFSTFKVKPYLYIHDVIVQKEYRGSGIGKKIVERCIEIAEERNYCKVTLEVRKDNIIAKTLYEDLGFRESEPLMHFWTKILK